MPTTPMSWRSPATSSKASECFSAVAGLTAMLELSHSTAGPAAPVVKVSAAKGDGITELWQTVESVADAESPHRPIALRRRLLALLQDHPELNVAIEGHTDADGSDAYNLDLSDRRAKSVVAWLVAKGIDAGRLQGEGKGEAAPVASNATADGKALNRRVEIRKL